MKHTKRMRSAVAMAAALLMLIGLLPVSVFAAGTVATLELNTPISVTGTYGNYAELTFTPAETGMYVLFSTDGSDPQARLYLAGGFDSTAGENPDYIAYNDDGNGLQFRLVYELEAGTEYLYVVDDRATSFPFTVELAKATAPTDITLCDGEDELSISLVEWYRLYYTLTPEEAAIDKVVFTSSDKSVLTVDEDGLICQRKPGTATVTATAGECSDTVTITVEEPLAWPSNNIASVIVTPDSRSTVYTFSVEEDGWYEIFSESNGVVAWMEVYYEEDGEIVPAYDGAQGEDFSWIRELSADTTYYFSISCMEYLASFTVSSRVAEEPEWPFDSEVPETGVDVLRDTLTVSVGDVFWPEYIEADDDMLVDITSSDETVAALDSYGGGQGEFCFKALKAGTTVLTYTAESGATDTITVTVTAAETISVAGTGEVTLTRDVCGQGFAFTPEKSDVYVIYSNVDADTYLYLLDSEFNVVDTDDDNELDGNFLLRTPLEAGETYYLLCTLYSPWDYEDSVSYTVTVTTVAPITSMEAKLDGALFEEDGVYYALVDNWLFYSVMFNPWPDAVEEAFEISIEGTSVADGLAYGELVVMGVGESTITFTSESGFTDTITVRVVEYKAGDLNFDGVVDNEDAAMLYAHLTGEKDLGLRALIGSMNKDNVLDMKDYFAIQMTYGTLGDVNDDGEVNSTDARLTLQYAVEKISVDDLVLGVADVNGDGVVNSTDARLILQYAVQKIQGFPAQQ